jgi:hypothetical protein
LFERHLLSVEKVGGIDPAELATMIDSLRRMERFWTDQIRYRL